MVVNLRETETKYDAPAGVALPGLEQLPQVAAVRGPEEQRLEAEYYDTDDLRLTRAGITLRRRSGGDAGRHLKLPAGADTRREIRRPVGGAARPVGLAAELHRLGGVLGAARDGEVLVDLLESGLRRAPVELRLGPVQARIQGHFASYERDACGAERLQAQAFRIWKKASRRLDWPG
jgi:hypothetical protein